MAIQCAWKLDPSVHWNAAGERTVGSQCVSSVLQLVFQCVPIMQINTGSPLGHLRVLASSSMVPAVCQCTCGSSGPPVCSMYTNYHWVATGTPLGVSISQCSSSGIPMYLWIQWFSSVDCPVVSQFTDRVWFGGHWVRPLSSMQSFLYTTGMVRVVWAKLISSDFQPPIHRDCKRWSYQRHTQSDVEVLTCFRGRTGIHCKAVKTS